MLNTLDPLLVLVLLLALKFLSAGGLSVLDLMLSSQRVLNVVSLRRTHASLFHPAGFNSVSVF